MHDGLAELERIARQAHLYSHVERSASAVAEHPFVVRDIYDGFPAKVRKLFDDGHYAEATFAALKYLDQTVQRASKLSKSGEALMMEAFKDDAPKIQLTPCTTTTERDEQRGYRFLFAGAAVGLRNPRGHEAEVADDLETCLSLSFATMLLRRLDRVEHDRKKAVAQIAGAAATDRYFSLWQFGEIRAHGDGSPAGLPGARSRGYDPVFRGTVR